MALKKAQAQIIAAQYMRGVADGIGNGGREASGTLACYYQQGFDDARGARKGLAESAPSQLGERDKDGGFKAREEVTADGLTFCQALRAAFEGVDSTLTAQAVYNRLGTVAQEQIDAL